MFACKDDWNLSFAGCGFLGVYHIGVASCLLEQAPEFVHGSVRLYGASAGALTAAVLASRASIAKCCEEVISLAQEARSRNLGPLHPSFNVMKVIRSGLQRNLPDDAHTLASGRLCVSLTRVSDGKNILVSNFNSKEELIQALICSCFIPVYCGLFPPSFRGVRYVDGGISDNLPQAGQKKTISISPFSGESDICPRDSSTSFHELCLTNTSIQMNLDNMFRLSRALFPPEPTVLAEMCQNGYKDAMRFLQENNLLRRDWPSAGPAPADDPSSWCCSCSAQKNSVVTETTKEWILRRLRLKRTRPQCPEEEKVANLPPPIRKVFCDACRGRQGLYAQMSDLLPLRMASYMLLPYTLPIQSAYSAAQRFVEWIPDVPADVRWLADVAGAAYQQAWRGAETERGSSDTPIMQQDGPPSISFMGFRGYDWNVTDRPSPPSSPRTPSPAPRQICLFVSPQD
ncbi:patatin-like phospholipase domain containing 3 [Alosa pseudoharengus]|uniref:patatin-like phospholipase domain containing 3 n=1 Tax=Alosa pseudoharengus TaxID=34774 RepID=UPI003F8B1996